MSQKKSVTVLALISCLFLGISCNPPSKGVWMKIAGPTQGTSYHITYFSEDSINYQSDIDSLLHRFDLSLSAWEPTSVISGINRGEDVQPDEYFIKCFLASREVFLESSGAFDITVGPLVNAWGFGFTEGIEIDSMIIDSLLQFVGMQHVRLEKNRIIKDIEGIMLDVNAIAQGYAVDVVADFFEQRGLKNYMVEIGGELRTKGKNMRNGDWRIGVDKPVDGNQIAGADMEAIIRISGKSLATSGNYRRFYEKDGIKYSHTISPVSGYPVRHGLLSATVLSDDCMMADAWATAFMVMGEAESLKFLDSHPGFEVFLIYNDLEGKYRTFSTEGLEKLMD